MGYPPGTLYVGRQPTADIAATKSSVAADKVGRGRNLHMPLTEDVKIN